MTYVMVDFSGHVNWSDKKIADRQKILVEYLKEHKLGYMIDPNLECYDGPIVESPISFYDFIISVDTKAEFLELCTFITEELKAPRRSIHIPYQILEVNGEGQFEVHHIMQVGGINIDDFVENIWGKKVSFPKIDVEF